MSTRAADRARAFYGSRLKSAGVPRKVLAPAMGISPQGVSKHFKGRVGALSYAALRGLAKADLRAALAVVDGARVECETAAIEGLAVEDLVAGLIPSLHAEQGPDGEEDCAQIPLAETLGAVVFMRDRLTLPLRRELTKRLDAWIDCKLRHIDAAMTALAHARALRLRLTEEG